MPLRDQLKRIVAQVAVWSSHLRFRLQPHHVAAQLQLAQAHLQQSNWSDALALVQQIHANAPDNAQAYQILAAIYSGQGKKSLALDAIATAIQLNPKVPWFYQDQGKLYLAAEHYTAAIAAFQTAIALDDQTSWFHFHLGETLVKQGNWSAAIAPLERAIQLSPLFAWSYYYLAEAEMGRDRVEAAIAFYQKAVLAAPDLPHLQNALAYAKHIAIQDQTIQAFVSQSRNQPPRQRHQFPRRPRALLLTPYPPYPPKLGAASRMFYEMKALHAKTDLVVVFGSFDKADFRLETDLADFSQRAIAVALDDRPPRPPEQSKAVHRYSSQRLTQVLAALNMADFDLVVIDFIYMAQYRDCFSESFVVLSEHNVESQILRRCADRLISDNTAADPDTLADRMEAETAVAQLEAFENQMWPQFPLRTVVSDLDQAIVDRRTSQGQTIVVNNGINTQAVIPFADNPVPRILFMGTLNYYPNIDGAKYLIETILPLIWQQNPQIECWIAGANPPSTLEQSVTDRRIAIIANPERMEDVAQQCCCTIVPLRIGGGTRIKILHAMAMGLPVISTSLGCEGLTVVDHQHLLIRDQPMAFAQATVQLVADATLRQTLRLQGRQLVERDYDWEKIFATAVDQMLTASEKSPPGTAAALIHSPPSC